MPILLHLVTAQVLFRLFLSHLSKDWRKFVGLAVVTFAVRTILHGTSTGKFYRLLFLLFKTAHVSTVSALPVSFGTPGLLESRGADLETVHRGHTLESIRIAGSWFAQQLRASLQRSAIRILIFNQQTRDANALARALHQTLVNALDDTHPFTHAVFCTNTTFKDAGYRPDLVSINTDSKAVQSLEVQHRLAKTWSVLDSQTEVKVVSTIEEVCHSYLCSILFCVARKACESIACHEHVRGPDLSENSIADFDIIPRPYCGLKKSPASARKM